MSICSIKLRESDETLLALCMQGGLTKEELQKQSFALDNVYQDAMANFDILEEEHQNYLGQAFQDLLDLMAEHGRALENYLVQSGLNFQDYLEYQENQESMTFLELAEQREGVIQLIREDLEQQGENPQIFQDLLDDLTGEVQEFLWLNGLTIQDFRDFLNQPFEDFLE